MFKCNIPTYKHLKALLPKQQLANRGSSKSFTELNKILIYIVIWTEMEKVRKAQYGISIEQAMKDIKFMMDTVYEEEEDSNEDNRN